MKKKPQEPVTSPPQSNGLEPTYPILSGCL